MAASTQDTTQNTVQNTMTAPDLNSFLESIKSPNPDIRYKAWRGAAPMGPAAIVPLGDLMASSDKGISKSAKGALETIVYSSTRPGARQETEAVSRELLKLASGQGPREVRVEALHLLGFTADKHSIHGISRLLSDPDVRDDARMALERIPGRDSLNALKKAARSAPNDFRPNLVQSIYNRGLTPKNAGTMA